MGRRDLKLNLWLKQRPRLMLCCSKADRGILIGSLLEVNRYLHIVPPISTALVSLPPSLVVARRAPPQFYHKHVKLCWHVARAGVFCAEAIWSLAAM